MEFKENKLISFEKECREKAEKLVAKMTPDEKLGLLSTHHNPIERLGMGEFWIGTEVARGFVGRDPEKYSTVFPQPIGLAATFDRELLLELGKIAGKEARAYYNRDKKGGLMLWGPTVDMERDPRWGRTEEAYGEDVCLAGELTAAYTLGMAGISDDGYYMTVPTLKHFCADNNEEDRVKCDAYLPLRLKYEYYYAAFENAIRKGGARSIMTAYNEINGVPAICNPDLQHILKEKWGLWFTVTDGADFVQILDDTHFGIRQGIQHYLDTGGVVGDGELLVMLLSVEFMGEFAHFQANALQQTFGHNLCVVVHVDQLVFDGRTAAIQN